MSKVLCDLLSDIGRLNRCSTVGDQHLVSSLDKEGVLLPFMSAWHKALLVSVERRTLTPLESLFVPGISDRLMKSGRNFLASITTNAILGAYGDGPDTVAFSSCYQAACLLTKFGAGDISDLMSKRAVDDYVAIERNIMPICESAVIDLAASCIRDLMGFGNGMIPEGRHGPGSVAEGAMPSGPKYSDWHLPPFCNIGFPSARMYLTSAHPHSKTDGTDPFMSRVCLVPKDWDKCRTICAEPAFLQYAQQGLNTYLNDTLRKATIVGWCTLDLADQAQNAQIALESSAHKYYATIDLSAASDRLSLELVERLFPRGIALLLKRCRSKRTKLPDGSVLELKKFGSMGNATTFPVQSIIFWAIAVAVQRLWGSSYRDARANCWVYGDDIICPSHCFALVCEALESVGLKVNTLKSFSEGSFRESCGIHAINGVDVTPSYLRTVSKTGPAAVSMCSTANLLSLKGWQTPAERIFSFVEDHLGAKLPYICDTGKPVYLDGDVQSSYDEVVSYKKRQPQLCRLLPPGSDMFAAIAANLRSGIPVVVDRYCNLSVNAFGLFEVTKLRRTNAFANTADMFCYLATHPFSGYDRGFTPGSTALSQRSVSLQ